MKSNHCIALLLAFAPPCQAATVFRCEDQAGHLTFSQQGCPIEQRGEPQTAHSPLPGTDSPTPLVRRERPTPARAADITIVGAKEDSCGNLLSDRERRTAVLRRQVRPGMSQADVESALGKPDRISGFNAKLRYHYERDPKRVVSFDERGCVPRK